MFCMGGSTLFTINHFTEECYSIIWPDRGIRKPVFLTIFLAIFIKRKKQQFQHGIAAF